MSDTEAEVEIPLHRKTNLDRTVVLRLQDLEEIPPVDDRYVRDWNGYSSDVVMPDGLEQICFFFYIGRNRTIVCVNLHLEHEAISNKVYRVAKEARFLCVRKSGQTQFAWGPKYTNTWYRLPSYMKPASRDT